MAIADAFLEYIDPLLADEIDPKQLPDALK